MHGDARFIWRSRSSLSRAPACMRGSIFQPVQLARSARRITRGRIDASSSNPSTRKGSNSPGQCRRNQHRRQRWEIANSAVRQCSTRQCSTRSCEPRGRTGFGCRRDRNGDAAALGASRYERRRFLQPDVRGQARPQCEETVRAALKCTVGQCRMPLSAAHFFEQTHPCAPRHDHQWVGAISAKK